MSEVETALSAAGTTVERAVAPTARMPVGAVLLLALINVLWSASAVPAKLALGNTGGYAPGHLGPYTLAFVRFAPSALLLYLLLRLRDQRLRIRREDYGRFFLLGALGLALTYGIFYGGMRFTTATESTLLIASEPILTAMIARLLLGERLTRIQSFGMAVGFTGVYFIVNRGLWPQFSPSVIANAVVTLALCFESSASVLGKRLTDTYPGLVVLTVEMLVGAAVLLPLAIGETVLHPPGPLSWQVCAGVVYLTLICSFFCYGVWFWLLPRYNVSAMAGFLFIQPMMGPMNSYLLLGERMSLQTGLAAILVVLGVWLVAVVGARKTTST